MLLNCRLLCGVNTGLSYTKDVYIDTVQLAKNGLLYVYFWIVTFVVMNYEKNIKLSFFINIFSFI